MKRRYRRKKRTSNEKQQVVQLPLSSEQLVTMLRENLHNFAMEMSLQVATQLLEEEVQQLCGERYAHEAEREYVRYGRQRGVIGVAGQKLPVSRPRVRTKDGKQEVPLKRYEHLQGDNVMPDAALKRMIRGVSCRDYEGVIDSALQGYGVEKSSVSRAFVKGSAEALKALRERQFADERFVVIFIDGVEFAGETCICALGVKANGEKCVLGLLQGATENAEVSTALLEELHERGVRTDQATLFVIDGGKALHKAIRRVWGRFALIQRCQVHKKRNLRSYLSDEVWKQIETRLSEAYSEPNYNKALQKLKTTVRWLERIAPDAAASLREGMEETLTVNRLGVSDMLRKTLCSTNPIESAFSVARNVTGRVKRWRDGDMRLRWCAAGLLKAEVN